MTDQSPGTLLDSRPVATAEHNLGWDYASDSDPVFPFPQSGQFFCELIPTAVQQVQVQGAGHFLQEDRGELLASEVLKIQT